MTATVGRWISMTHPPTLDSLMRVHVLLHGRCFDGASSAAIFKAFFRERAESAEFVFIPKHHRRGDPYEAADFAGADETVVVDFRYTQHPGLTWYFDHHRSAFQLPGDREHFESDRTGQKFHDPAAPSCTGYIARIAAEQFGFDPAPYAELLHWAEVIDSADFATPAIPVLYEEPALQLAAWIQSASDPDAITGFIDDLLNTRMGVLAQAKYVRELVEPRLESHRVDIELIRQVHTIDHGVFCYDLLDHGPRVLSHFIPYWISPKVRYCVGIYAHSDGDLRLSVGYNPWLPAKSREYDVAALCERHGGGGHPYVAGASLPADHIEELRATMDDVVATLTGRQP